MSLSWGVGCHYQEVLGVTIMGCWVSLAGVGVTIKRCCVM